MKAAMIVLGETPERGRAHWVGLEAARLETDVRKGINQSRRIRNVRGGINMCSTLANRSFSGQSSAEIVTCGAPVMPSVDARTLGGHLDCVGFSRTSRGANTRDLIR